MNAGMLNLQRSKMDFMFEIARSRATQSAGTGMQPTKTWVVSGRRIPCDINPLENELYFLQSGTENQSTVVIHFYANEDIAIRDKVQLLSTRRLAGPPIGQWYDIQRIMQPTSTIAFLRAFAVESDTPGTGTV